MRAGDTIQVRGENGVVMDVDVPEEGTHQRELLEAFLAKGTLTLLSEPEPEEEADVMPSVSDKVGVWREYAVAHGMDADDAAKAKKADLIALFTEEDEEAEGETPEPDAASEGGEG